MNEWLLTTYERALLCKSDSDLACVLFHISDHFGFSGVAMTSLPNDRIDLADAILITNWDSNWIARYSEQRYQQHDLIFRRAKHSNEVFSWSNTVCNHKGKAMVDQIMSEAAEFGMTDGLVVPTHFSLLGRVVYSFSVDKGQVDLTKKDILTLRAALASISERYCTIERGPAKTILTTRQAEVLQNLALGNSIPSVAADLNVSISTVRKHCENVRRAYQAKSIMEAIYNAQRDGTIRI